MNRVIIWECKIIETTSEKIKMDKTQLFFNEFSLSIGLSLHLEFPNSKVNLTLLRGKVTTLECTCTLSCKSQVDTSTRLGRVEASTL